MCCAYILRIKSSSLFRNVKNQLHHHHYFDNLTVTAGNFYEQFGSGLILRSFEERTLGIDNALDGLRLKYAPISEPVHVGAWRCG